MVSYDKESGVEENKVEKSGNSWEKESDIGNDPYYFVYRVISNANLVRSLCGMPTAKFIRVYSEFFSALHDHTRASKNASGPLVYARFTPPWLHRAVQFVVEDLHLEGLSYLLDLQHVCISSQECEPEKSPDFLQQDYVSKKRVLLENSHDDDVLCSVRRHRILRRDMKTLALGQYVNDLALNAFMSLLENKRITVIDSSFTGFIAQRGVEYMRRWSTKERVEQSDFILLPLHSYSSVHWGLAIFSVSEKQGRLDVYDSLSSLRALDSLLPKLIAWAKKLRRAIWGL
eukprot:IDg4601t1